jgi:hypothetical protein
MALSKRYQEPIVCTIVRYNASVVKIYNASVVKIYNASVVKIYNVTSSLVCFENKNMFF